MRKVARLLEERNNPARILVVTFTRTGAADLKGQLEAMGLPTAELVVASTLHGLCFGILGKREVLESTNRFPRTLYEFEVDTMLVDVGPKFGGIRERRRRLRAYEASEERLEDMGIDKRPELSREFVEALEDWLRFHNAMLVGELIPLTLEYIRKNPASPDKTAFEHILVDEYQDLNNADQAVIQELATAAKLTVVGDDNQSIYSFRYANPRGIIEFPAKHTGTRSETLVECRRCPKKVIEIANHFIDPGGARLDRHLRPVPGCSEGETLLLRWESPADEVEGIRKLLAAYLKSKTPGSPGDILILVPRKRLGTRMKAELVQNFVAAETVFPEDMLDSAEIRDRLVLLQLLVNPEDRAALRYWLAAGSTTGRASEYDELRRRCVKAEKSPVQLLDQLSRRRTSEPELRGVIDRYRNLMDALGRFSALEGADFMDAWVPPEVDALKPLRDLVTSVIDPKNPKELILRDIKSLLTQPEVPSAATNVRIMTLHKAKGLSAHTVIVLGCVEGLIPSYGSAGSVDEQTALLAEQRRLFYVAMTRAKERLILSTWVKAPQADAMQMGATNPKWAGKGIMMVRASRFISELKSPPLMSSPGRNYLDGLGIS
jgi:superfamily I DNA/RNA helicase